MTRFRSVREAPAGSAAGVSGFRMRRDEIMAFGDPLTRMLLASDGFTMPALEAVIGRDLHVQVLHQVDHLADCLPVTVTASLRVSAVGRVIVRRSCLVDAAATVDAAVSVNHVVSLSGPAATYGLADSQVPIGQNLMSQGLSQRRHLLRAGLMRWPDGRLAATRAYLLLLGDRPLCYIRESFNPAIIPPDHTPITDRDLHWADEPQTDRPAPPPD
ncbi:DUF98 domain-containing protein [Kribbella antibiotica]|uniref:DUF98 domain-containing protein n=1 Tax=Kribbella antibiotica TaxID=190195 RepID=A0A4R4ZPN1_9ACTN|nr:DUF98 domain-containing protein [Kribbella antibiotica]